MHQSFYALEMHLKMFQKLAGLLFFTTQDLKTICNTSAFYLSCNLCAIWYKQIHQIISALVSCKCRKYAAVRNLLLEWFHKMRCIHHYLYYFFMIQLISYDLLLIWFTRDWNISNRCLNIKHLNKNGHWCLEDYSSYVLKVAYFMTL